MKFKRNQRRRKLPRNWIRGKLNISMLLARRFKSITHGKWRNRKLPKRRKKRKRTIEVRQGRKKSLLLFMISTAGRRRSRLMSQNINQVHLEKNPNYLMILQRMLVAPKYRLGRWKSLRRLLDKMKSRTLLWDYRIGSTTNIILISHLKKRKMKTVKPKVREMIHALKDQTSARQVVVLIPNSTQLLLTHQQKRSNLTNQREYRKTSWSDQRARVTQRHWHQTLIPTEESIKASHP